jgi:hypothetical protein
MFQSLDEQSKTTPRERGLFYAAVLLISTALFGSLYLGIRFFD